MLPAVGDLAVPRGTLVPLRGGRETRSPLIYLFRDSKRNWIRADDDQLRISIF